MPSLSHYIEYCQKSTSLHELSINTFQFISTNFKKLPLTLLWHKPCPGTLEILESNDNNTLESYTTSLKQLNKQSITGHIIEANQRIYGFSSLAFTSDIIYIFVFDKKEYEELEEIIKTWRILNEICKNSKTVSLNETKNKYSTLISQLMHDVQSLMELSPDKNDKQILKQVSYQKNLNKNLLFYIRDFDLFKSKIKVKKLIKDSLSLIDKNAKNISLELFNPKASIIVDVELFSTAFNAIVQNAIEATESDFTKIKIKICRIDSLSPFAHTKWTVFEVIDFGGGISKDFIPYIKNPFFTTKKYKGCSGFGLSNADKIINAHNGILEITSGSVTNIKVLIPET